MYAIHILVIMLVRYFIDYFRESNNALRRNPLIVIIILYIIYGRRTDRLCVLVHLIRRRRVGAVYIDVRFKFAYLYTISYRCITTHISVLFFWLVLLFSRRVKALNRKRRTSNSSFGSNYFDFIYRLQRCIRPSNFTDTV